MIQPNTQQEEPLHRAARLGDIAQMERLLIQGVDINVRANLYLGEDVCMYQITPLMQAAWSIDGATVETLRFLVERGADIYATDAWGKTAVWYSIKHCGFWKKQRLLIPDSSQKLEYLLDVGLEAQERQNSEFLLLDACYVGDPKSLSILLQRFASTVDKEIVGKEIVGNQIVNKQNFYSHLLLSAVQSGNPECVRILLKSGADPNTRDSEGRSSLMYTACLEIAKLLIDAGCNIHATDDDDYDALQNFLEARWFVAEVSQVERLRIAHTLLKLGVDIERCDKYGWSRLHNAAFRHDYETLEFLVNCGANPYTVDKNGSTALHAACWLGDPEDATKTLAAKTINLLLSLGLDVNALDAKGNTPLHEAAAGDWGSLTAIHTLLRHGAKPDPVGADGITPLMLAASRGEFECIRTLLQAGANPMQTDLRGNNAINYAQEYYDCWLCINKKPNDTVTEVDEDFFQVQSNHRLALQEAAECLKLLCQHINPY
jgi:ankyrin repeat protein